MCSAETSGYRSIAALGEVSANAGAAEAVGAATSTAATTKPSGDNKFFSVKVVKVGLQGLRGQVPGGWGG